MPEPRHALGRVELSARAALRSGTPGGVREIGLFSAGPEDVTEWGAPESPWARALGLDPPSEATTVSCTPAPVVGPAIAALFGEVSPSLDLEASRPIDAVAVVPPMRAPVHEEPGGALVIEEKGGVEILVVLDDLIRNTGDVDPYARLVETSVDLVEPEPVPAPASSEASSAAPFEGSAVIELSRPKPTRERTIEVDDHLAELEACFAEAAESISDDVELPPLPNTRLRVIELDERSASAPVADAACEPRPRRARATLPRWAGPKPLPFQREALVVLGLAAVPIPFRRPLAFHVRYERPQPAVLPKTNEQALAAILDELAAPKRAPHPHTTAASRHPRPPSLVAPLSLVLAALVASVLVGLVAAQLGAWAELTGAALRLVSFGAAGVVGLWLVRAPDVMRPFRGLAPRTKPTLVGFAIAWGLVAGIALVRLEHSAFPGGARALAAFARIPAAAFFASIAAITVDALFFRVFLGKVLGRAFASATADVLLQTAAWALFLLTWRTSPDAGPTSATLLQIAASTALLGAPMAFFQRRTGRAVESVVVHVTATLIALVGVSV
ncbi:hypothetical protein L6R52_02310 [Myxococcota bacterium]|nr:hypothetical protein [Myxococcota bacterium]